MKLILVRHGEAHPNPQADFERTLTARGQSQAAQTASLIFEKYAPTSFVVSPLKRARQTLEAFANVASQKNMPASIHVCDSIKPNDDAAKALDVLSSIQQAQQSECMLVVCHMNIIAHMASLLTGDSFVPFNLAEARVLEQEVIATGMSTLLGSHYPT